MSSIHPIPLSPEVLEALVDDVEEMRRHELARLTARVTKHEANQVLRHFHSNEGYPAGGFTQCLLAAFAHADPANFKRLEDGFPCYGAAMRLAMHYEGGMDRLREIAGGAK